MKGVSCGLLATLICAPALSAQGDPGAVSLHFGWSAGLEAEITQRRTTVTSGEGERPESSAVTATYRMRVATHPRGLLVEYLDFKVPDLSSTSLQSLPLGGVGDLLATFNPALVISDEGRTVAIADPDGYARRLQTAFQPYFDALPARKEQFRGLLSQAADPAVQGAIVEGDWNALIGWWAGTELVRGHPVESTEDQAMPLFGGEVIPYHTRRTFVSRAPCRAGASDSTCVILELTTTPDSAAVRARLDAMLSQAQGTPQASAVLRRAEMGFLVRVRLEPASLVPHELDIIQTAQVEAGSATATAYRASMERTRTISFTYPRR